MAFLSNLYCISIIILSKFYRISIALMSGYCLPVLYIYIYLQANNSGTRREQRCCSDNQSRPGDIFHPDFLRGHPTYFDVSVTNSLQQSFIVSSAITAGSAAAAGEMEKDLRHQLNVESTGSIFYPLVVCGLLPV